MRLEDMDGNYWCLSCDKRFVSSNKDFHTFSYDGRDYKGIDCAYCGEGAKLQGYKMNVTISAAKLNNQQQRKEHRTALLQPWRQGEISKEYLDAYPKQRDEMIKDGVITKEQAKNAKEVWSDKADIL